MQLEIIYETDTDELIEALAVHCEHCGTTYRVVVDPFESDPDIWSHCPYCDGVNFHEGAVPILDLTFH